jgi:hypothetical protein
MVDEDFLQAYEAHSLLDYLRDVNIIFIEKGIKSYLFSPIEQETYMEAALSKYLNALEKGTKISLVLTGIIVDGTLEGVVDNCVLLSNATSHPSNKKQYQLTIPFENIYAWGQRQKKKGK